MKFEFEAFTANVSFDARITIRQGGYLGFNQGALNKYRVAEFQYAYLFFDRSRRVIGLKLDSGEEEPGAFQINASGSNTFLRAKPFLDFYDIDYSSAHRARLHRDEDSGMLYFMLDEESEEKTASGHGNAPEAEDRDLAEDGKP